MASFENLSPRQKRILDEVFRDLDSSLSISDARLMLEPKSVSNIQLANPNLQPIAFAIRHVTWKTYLYGVVGEIFAWIIFLISILLWFLAIIIIIAIALFGRLIILNARLPEKLARIVYQFTHGRWAARRRRYNAYKRLCADKRAPVLYLRSFSFDQVYDLPLKDARRADERLAEFYERYGPVIAVAGPDDKGPMLGPVRLYFDDDMWRAGVIYLMSISQLVIIQAGISQGTLWELGMARRHLEPSKIIISIADAQNPSVADSYYTDFKPYAEAILGCELPVNVGPSPYIAFGENWEPFIQGSRGEWLPGEITERKHQAYKEFSGVKALTVQPYDTKYKKCLDCGLGNAYEVTTCERCGKTL